MRAINQVHPNDLIKATAVELKKLDEVKAPNWSLFVKTGVHKEKPPVDPDWWYTRAAAILRSVYSVGPVGVSKLRTKYGGRKNRGVASDKVFKGSGKVIRVILQQLEAAGLVKQGKKGIHKGRVITPKGLSFLSGIASPLAPEPKKAPKKKAKKKKPEVKKEEKPKETKTKEEKKKESPKKEEKKSSEKKESKEEEKKPSKEKKPKKASKKKETKKSDKKK